MRDRKRVGSRQRSLSFLSFLPRRERTLLAGKLATGKLWPLLMLLLLPLLYYYYQLKMMKHFETRLTYRII